MIKILIVADNNMFVRTIYSFLSTDDKLSVKAVFNSNEIFKGYLKHQPEIIILDNALLIPMSSIIDHFNAYHWRCKFIVVKSSNSKYLPIPELSYVEPSKDSICSVIQSMAEQISKNALEPDRSVQFVNDLVLPAGQYNMMLSFQTNPFAEVMNPNRVQQFKQEIALLGDYEVYTFDGNNFLILIKKNWTRFPFSQVHSLLCKIIDKHYASVYMEGCNRSELHNICEILANYEPISYFFTSQCKSLNQIREKKNKKNEFMIHDKFINIIELIFSHDQTMLESSIHGLYLSDIKNNLSIKSLKEAHNWLQFFNKTLFLKRSLPPLNFLETRLPIEMELKKVQTYFEAVAHSEISAPISAVARDSALLILREYPNADLSLAILEKSLGFSKSYISRAFSSQFGITIVEFLQKLRVEIARNLLESTDIPVYQIAETAGFNDAQYLSKLFNRYIGMYPTAYRAMFREEVQCAVICKKFKS